MKAKLVGRKQRTDGRPHRQLLKRPSMILTGRSVIRKWQKNIAVAGAALLYLMLQSGTVLAQGDSVKTQALSPVEMAGTMRSNGKIYVVVAVLVIILAGLFTYLTRLDRKITRLEKGTWKE